MTEKRRVDENIAMQIKNAVDRIKKAKAEIERLKERPTTADNRIAISAQESIIRENEKYLKQLK